MGRPLNGTYAFGRWVWGATFTRYSSYRYGINPYSFIAPNGASGRFVIGGLHWSF